jgi:ABC-type molybdate transport system ATPase subunit
LESQPDYKTVLQIIDVTVARILNTERTALFLVDADGKNLYAQVFSVSKEDEPLVTLDHLETTCFENYLNHLGRKLNVVSYNGSTVAYGKLS